MYIFCKTDIGKKRELNEDYVLVFKSPNYSLMIVADGMGATMEERLQVKLLQLQ
ncbi:hypothetical protein PL321_17230 [Caloramator sp. mosi_1]|uniref:hypothetical protein n=1 Tax=Caloramator sp. mosi_1 TaxID=3023090 RepID=UPI00236135AC|nr:hypothetical protein [Caloramator sp. mosi_1]WDC84048.1 hypothetical protein PL321_17230 [Caloramator sp. mosi_1]